ncbi:bifunctional aspartate kinase/diaminopimelate decarboxylase [Lujinxingia litoralis]|uniref:Diaminopimelate decarboxylase n=1 Tax=Lujinxingia litoralis TaxID=2211119 RepID=A0A328C6I4_9DELT|nr:bifunctional aspartate kinase/diaminopimelate decarboxylase [Lujinxingia litoralis]RAL20981.1 bifunctional aspartate kinase/diaminopimelate decarboxylase [Lujinxingia litoralis]
MATNPSWVVLKFGGTSVSSRGRWETIAEVISERLTEEATGRVMVVCSALSGVTNQLEEIIAQAPRGAHHEVLAAIVQKHLRLGDDLGVDAELLLHEEFSALERLALGASLVGEVSPRVQAQILSCGELMSTRLGAAFVGGLLKEVRWMDARTLLRTVAEPHASLRRRYLSAACEASIDRELQARLAGASERVVMTQGFIASNDAGESVLLGRGGSDTSAAYLAAALQAERLEIWTDVPGMFSANPRQVATARLLKRLDYAEAQELATMGARVLHPRCLGPVREHNIALHIRCTPEPRQEGTVIAAQAVGQGPQVKAVSAKHGVTVISMETLGMWQQVGFLADTFAVFKEHGLSIDMVATSESEVSVTLDPMANALDPAALARLQRDLGRTCKARIVEGCAVVSLVGRQVRSILSQLAPALNVFEEQQIYLVSQSASDLNLSFVVDEAQADRLVSRLHQLLFGEQGPDALFGPSWEELSGRVLPQAPFADAWWRGRRDELLKLAEQGATYAYSPETLRTQAARLTSMASIDRVFFAIKANPNPEILRLLEARGLGFECVSPGEVAHIRELFPQLETGRLLFTPNFAPRREYEQGFEAGAMVTLDNLYPLEAWPEVFEGREVLVRVDPGQGAGHHRYVRTAGPKSKFGVSVEELPRLAELAEQINLKVVGLHAHVGSGVRRAGTWSSTAVFLAQCRAHFPDVRWLNLGGGLGVPERPGQEALDLGAVDASLAEFKKAHPTLELWLEPGRFLVSEAGVLLARVTQLKTKGAYHYVGLETGMNSLIRPALYGAYHAIVNLTRQGEAPEVEAEIVGPICESGDVLGHARWLPRCAEGDVLLLANAGSYGRAMSSRYNLREPAAEVMLPALELGE